VYGNFLGDEGPARVREAYPGRTWDRPVAVKRRYDPDNLFRRNQNIPRPLTPPPGCRTLAQCEDLTAMPQPFAIRPDEGGRSTKG
jgi:hypothetical protein